MSLLFNFEAKDHNGIVHALTALTLTCRIFTGFSGRVGDASNKTHHHVELWSDLWLSVKGVSPLSFASFLALCWATERPPHHVGTGLVLGQLSFFDGRPQCFGAAWNSCGDGESGGLSGHRGDVRKQHSQASPAALIQGRLWGLAGAPSRTGQILQRVSRVSSHCGAAESFYQLRHPLPPADVRLRSPDATQPPRTLPGRGLEFWGYRWDAGRGRRSGCQSKRDEEAPWWPDRAEGHRESPPGS